MGGCASCRFISDGVSRDCVWSDLVITSLLLSVLILAGGADVGAHVVVACGVVHRCSSLVRVREYQKRIANECAGFLKRGMDAIPSGVQWSGRVFGWMTVLAS